MLGRIRVRCSHYGCLWVGEASDLRRHEEGCTVQCPKCAKQDRKIIKLCEEVKRSTAECAQRDRHTAELRQQIKQLTEDYTKLQESKQLASSMEEPLGNATDDELRRECAALRLELQQAKAQYSQTKKDLKAAVPANMRFKEDYQYTRHEIPALSCLISRYLVRKLDSIDSDKIYECMEAIHNDFQAGKSDNPKFMAIDLKMLLATALASNWFTAKQRSNVEDWEHSLHQQ